MHSGYIHDGYTEHGFIAAIPRLHPAVRFTFRPFLQEERLRLLNENAKLQPAKASENTAKVLGSKIKTWNLADEKGDSIKLDAAAIRRLKPALFERLMGIVMGVDASDEDPDATPTENSAGLADELAALESGKPVGDEKAAADQKN